MAKDTRTYRGFISYSQRDKAFAKRLHAALERFKLPNGEKLGRFFRDDDELGSQASLGEALESAITGSEDLIVLASPHSAHSKWVNEEVTHFKKLADPDKQVFAIILSGYPHAEEKNRECFVPALRSKVAADGTLTGERDEPLAPDARKESFHRLVTKIVAGLEGIPFDDLWQREKRRARARLIRNSAVIAAIAVPLIGWGVMSNLELGARTSQLQSLDTETQRQNFLAAYFTQLQDRQFANLTPEEYVITQTQFDEGAQVLLASDLNGDGYQDYFARIEFIDFCGSAGCMHEIFAYDDGAYRSVHLSNGGDLQVLTSAQNGYQDLALGFGGFQNGPNTYTLLRYDGERYNTEGYALCDGVTTYCGLSSVFTDDPSGETLAMTFRAIGDEERSAITSRVNRDQIFAGYSLGRGYFNGEAYREYDQLLGLDESGEYALVDVWKGTHAVAKLNPE